MCEQEEKKNKAGSEEVLDLNHGCPDNPFYTILFLWHLPTQSSWPAILTSSFHNAHSHWFIKQLKTQTKPNQKIKHLLFLQVWKEKDPTSGFEAHY